MSAKLLHTITDENPDLKKQIGCMTGIFQLFDRHHVLTGRRVNGIHSHKRLPPGDPHFKSGNLGIESNNVSYLQTATEKKSNKNVNEKQRASTESSRASFSSSSCSSSFSSLDCNKTAQPESSFFDRTIFPETPSRDPTPVNQPNASPQSRQQSLDLRDVIKDSIYREARGLSVKTTTKDEAVGCAMKYRDSPRPLQFKCVDGSYGVGINGKPRVPTDLKESLRVLAKLREVPRNFNEARELPRSSYAAKDGSLPSVPKDAPRFSYDGREIHRQSFESRDTYKSTTKLKEFPRLSLDSREGSMRGCNSDPKSNSLLSSNKTIPNLLQESGTQKRPPSVVAKLMGLEALPDSISATEDQMGFIKTCPGEDRDTFSRSSKTTAERKQNLIPDYPRNSHKDPISPQLINPDSVMKPISSSRFPIEPAPWRHPNGGRGFQKPAYWNQEATATAPNFSPSVYSEIEEKLKELEFKHSDKDLRALKHILEAMQVKGLLETKKDEDQASNPLPQRNYNGPNYTSLDQNPRLANSRITQNNRMISATVKGARPPRTFESPIVIIKPAKFIEKSSFSASPVIPIDGLSGLRKLRSGDSVDGRKGSVNIRTAKDLTPINSLRDPTNQAHSSTAKKTNGSTLRSTQTSMRPQQLSRENATSSGRSSVSVSPRLQLKKLDLEKRSHPPIPSSDSSKPKRQSSRKPTESGSPGGKLRPKSPILQLHDGQLSEISCEMRNLSHQGDEISLRSESNVSLASQIDTEATSTDKSAEINCAISQQGIQSPSRKVANYLVSGLKQKKPTPRLSEDGLLAEVVTVAPEQPSPVSVLDTSFYGDDLPCPVKKISNVFTDGETRNSNDNPGDHKWDASDLSWLSDSTRSNLSLEFNRKKLENIEHLVQKIRQLNSNHEESTPDYIASLCENTHPDHRYISEILLASGLLLRDLGSGLSSIQLHPSGHPINPDLFFVLEQTKASTRLSKDEKRSDKVVQPIPSQEKLHRKLIFDAVNEIIARKLSLTDPLPEPWFQPDKLAGRTLSAQRLLRELCSEIEHLQGSNSHCPLANDDDCLKSILWEDMMHRAENWTSFHGGVSGIVLDVERLVFKDLVDEIVRGEAASLRARPSSHCRQLFAK
ncbi:hypothetical protein HHK36_007368 [Tetracentron sinense]|uniref:DUF4378 domain-containing protein n=1 Tax=Tetracentron sinense TaxID=13715 RepID=A0A835DLG1_TETSI|nr:hypothetical protein HHK36_007368 [Tetracentron sinense]